MKINQVARDGLRKLRKGWRISQPEKRAIFDAVMASKQLFKPDASLKCVCFFLNGSSCSETLYSTQWVEFWKKKKVTITGYFEGPNSDVPYFMVLWGDGTATQQYWCWRNPVTFKTRQTEPSFEDKICNYC